jgi:hypothetical protein
MSQSGVCDSVSCSTSQCQKLQNWMWFRCQVWGNMLSVIMWQMSLMNVHHECILIWGKMMYDFRNMLETTLWCHEHFSDLYIYMGQDKSVQPLATGWKVGASNPGVGSIFRTHPGQPWGPPSRPYNGYQVFLRGKAARMWHLPPTPIQPWG